MEEIRKTWDEMKVIKRFYEGGAVPYTEKEVIALQDKFEEVEILFGHESTLSKAIIYCINKNK